MTIKISKGLNLSLEGGVNHQVLPKVTNLTSRIAILGKDFHGIRPTMFVSEGQQVTQGEKLFEDKKNPGYFHLCPVNGTISEINRGDRRSFLSMVIEKSNDDASFDVDTTFEKTNDQILNFLNNFSLLGLFRTRPFSKVPLVGSLPNKIFISLIDSNPLSFDPALILKDNLEAFNKGLEIISYLPKEGIHVGIAENNTLDLYKSEKINYHIFSGPHPIGLVGTQINKISPASLANQIWTIGYQELIKIGKTILTGCLSNEKYISISGPQVFNPEIVLTNFGACVEELTAGKLTEEDNRLISGSVLCGHICDGPLAYLSSFSNQLTVIREANQDDREFLNWLRPEIKKHSSLRMFLSSAIKNYKYNLTSALNGGFRAIVPVGVYEEIFPMNLMITQLLKAIVTEDTELAQSLGVLELDEEDLALCTYSCPSKYDYGLILRNILDKIEKDG
jgi:Na+-transporting NADH:ubiquinone oxidoreductase subunit A